MADMADMAKHESTPPTAEQLLERSNKAGYFRLIGLKIESAEEGVGRASIEVDERLYHPMQIVHGGVIFTLADTAMAHALLSVLPWGTQSSTIEAKINYLRPVRTGILEAEAKILHQGRTIAVLEAVISNTVDGVRKEIGRMIGTFHISPPK